MSIATSHVKQTYSFIGSLRSHTIQLINIRPIFHIVFCYVIEIINNTPSYFKEIKGPFNDIKLLACSGVTPANLPDYFTCGASAAAIGSSVFSKDRLALGRFNEITESVQAYLKSLKTVHIS